MGYLASLNDELVLRGDACLALTFFQSFRTPWRCTISTNGDELEVELLAWALRTRAESGGTDYAMLTLLDATEPLIERTHGSSGGIDLRFLPLAATLGDVVHEGILDGWNATVRYRDRARANTLRVRCDLSQAPVHAELLAGILAVARARLRTERSLQRLEQLAAGFRS